MVRLVAALQPAQDRDRVRHRRLAHEDLLEPPLQGRVLLDPLAVLVERGRAHHPQLAPGQHRLEHVARVHGALGRPGADHRVQLVDERDDLAFALLDLVQYRLEPLLELAAVLRAGHHRAQVQRYQALAAQRLRHVAGDHALSQPLDYGGLAHAGLADEHGVVLGPPGQYLDDPPDLGVPADHRVQAAGPGLPGQVDAVLLQRLVGTLRVLRRDPRVPAYLLERLDQRLGAGAGLPEQVSHVTAAGREADEQVLGGDELVAQLPGLVGGGVDRRQQRPRCLRGTRRGARHPGQPGQQVLGAAQHVGRVRADRAQQRSRGAAGLLDQGGEQVRRADLRVTVGRGSPHRRGQRLLALAGELLIHVLLLLPSLRAKSFRRHAARAAPTG